MMKTFHRQAALFLIFMLGALALVPATHPAAQSVAGHLDGTFGAGGVVTLDVQGLDDEATGVLVQPDGKVVVAGRSGSSLSEFVVARCLADGWRDEGFGDLGRARIAIIGQFSYANALARTSDGKLIVGGDVLLSNGGQQVALVRLNDDGQLDTSFGQFGKVIGPLEERYATVSAHLQKMVVEPDGKLLVMVLYYFFGSSSGSPVLYRLQANGSLDPTFFFGAYADDLMIQPDGKIVTAGLGVSVQRLHPDGRIDVSFGNSFGTVRLNDLLSLGLAASPAIALTADGKLLVAFSLYRRGGSLESDFALVRLNTDGSLDTSFGTNGMTIADVATNDHVKELLVQPDGKILLAGYAGTDSPATRVILQASVALLRFNADGMIDEGFKADPLPDDTRGLSVANAITLQTDGRIVIAGGIRNAGSENMFVARYESGTIIPPPPTPDFALTADPATLNATAGSKVRFAITINRVGGFTGAVSIGTVVDPPKMHITTIEPSADGLTFTYTLKIKGKAKAGTYPLVFVGEDATGRKRSVTVTLIVT
ncbi:MAG: hypothetical protein ACJ74G_14680 [Blastocatellia bacterium]